MATASTLSTRRASVRKPPQPHCFTGDELPREVRCEYPSKFCNNHKALKTKGGMHKFCELHRRKANLNQKRWQQRRREMREQDRYLYTAPVATSGDETAPAEATTYAPVTPPHKLASNDAGLVALSPTDVIEPFPIGEFTTTPPANGRAGVQPMLHTNTMDPFHHGFANAGGFPLEDDLDVLTTLFFSDTQANAQSLYNWHGAGFDTASAAYTLTGPSAAIV